MAANPICPVTGEPTTILHHKSGRKSKMMDQSTWLAVSRRGHQFIHLNPNIAVERGWLDPEFAPEQQNGHAFADLSIYRIKFVIPVIILGSRSAFGRKELRVSPVGGRGEHWITEQQVTKTYDEANPSKNQRHRA